MSSSDSSEPRAGASWRPAQYGRFSGPRLRPALDLLGRVTLSSPKLIYDLGCGTGEVTRILAQRFPQARVVGVDSSPEMLDEARRTDSAVTWEEGDIACWAAQEEVDLLYSNAALHWLPDHGSLFPRLAATLAEGGVFAAQMPLNWSQPSHRLLRTVLAEGGSGGAPLGDEGLRQTMAEPWVLEAEEYFRILLGEVASLDIWKTEYLHVLRGEDPVLEWVRGTLLRPVLGSLSATDLEVFLRRYRDALRDAYPPLEDGSTLYPFQRLFLLARR